MFKWRHARTMSRPFSPTPTAAAILPFDVVPAVFLENFLKRLAAQKTLLDLLNFLEQYLAFSLGQGMVNGNVLAEYLREN